MIPGIIVYDDTPGSSLAGDYNSSGLVEQGDLDLVLLNWGANASPAPDGWNNPDYQPTEPQINQDELDGVLLNWGNTAGECPSGTRAQQWSGDAACWADGEWLLVGTPAETSTK